MFVAIPLETKPSWRSPPWMTVLLILVNCAIYWGWQVPEERAVARAAQVYAGTPLPAMELPRFVAHVREQARRDADPRTRALANAAQALLQRKDYAGLYRLMWQERLFKQYLLDGKIIITEDGLYPEWSVARAAFAPHEPRPFTERWAMSYEPGAGWQPVQALTSTFLHGSAGHLIGNMVFLFLFGFTLEMALGAFTYLGLYLVCGVAATWFALPFYAGMGGLGLGASGAISGLMAMYAVMYRMRRIRFFYMLGPYFNYARWPALVMLPVWLAFEGVQHLMGGRQVAYMAHFGGLVAGAVCMALYMRLKTVRTPEARAERAQADVRPLQEAVARAQRHTDALAFDRATPAWRAAAKLAPTDAQVLRSWFDSARHDPAGEDFHAAARRIFKLPARADDTARLQHHAWRVYNERAKPGPRISADTLHGLARSFVRVGEWGDAERICQQLQAQPEHPQWPATLSLVANGLARAGPTEQARAWLPSLMQHAPQEPITRWLAQSRG
jgi:membrane associated rhomboid family serine protease